jgi:hypothetical protein
MSATVLLTPLMLVAAAPSAAFDAPIYSHQAQTTAGVQLAQFRTAFCMTTSTAAGTQTFDYQGRPWDSDSDSDQQGDC